MPDQININALSEILSTALINSPGAKEQLSSLLSHRVTPVSSSTDQLTKEERKQLIRHQFNRLSLKESLKTKGHAG